MLESALVMRTIASAFSWEGEVKRQFSITITNADTNESMEVGISFNRRGNELEFDSMPSDADVQRVATRIELLTRLRWALDELGEELAEYDERYPNDGDELDDDELDDDPEPEDEEYGWHVYSDGSDDEPGNEGCPGSWDIAPCKAGERRQLVTCSAPGNVQCPWQPLHRAHRLAAEPLAPTVALRRLMRGEPTGIEEPEGGVAAFTRFPDDPPPAPEPEVPAEVRPWLDALREVWPEMSAKFDGAAHYDVPMNQRLVASVHASGANAFIHRAFLVDPFPFYDTPAALVAALKRKLGVPEPKPEPTRPALWQMVRAACESELGEPDWSHGHLRFRTKRLRSVWVYPHIKRPEWVVDYPGNEVFCRTPAELTAALNALAEE